MLVFNTGQVEISTIPVAVSSMPWAGILIHPAQSPVARLPLALESDRPGEQMTHCALGYTGCRDPLSQILTLAFIHTPCAPISVWYVQHQIKWTERLPGATGVALRRLTDVETSKY